MSTRTVKKWTEQEDCYVKTIVEHYGVKKGYDVFNECFPGRTPKAFELRWYKVKNKQLQFDKLITEEIKAEPIKLSIWKRLTLWFKNLFK